MSLPLVAPGRGERGSRPSLPRTFSNHVSVKASRAVQSVLFAQVESSAFPPLAIVGPCRNLTPPTPHEKVSDFIQRNSFDPKDLNKANEEGRTPLTLAVLFQDREMVRSLKAAGADLYQRDKQEYSVLDLALLMNDFDMAQFLIKEMGFDVNKTNNNRTSLTHSIEEGNIDHLRFLIEKGADVDLMDGEGRTPLIEAVRKNNVDCLRFLIESGADVNLPDGEGQTPLIEAVRQDNCEIVKLLIKKGARIDQVDRRDGYTPLTLAISRNRLTVVDCLIGLKADINRPDGQGLTPLSLAIMKGHLEILSFLKRSGVFIDELQLSQVVMTAISEENYNSLKCIELLGIKIVTACDKQENLKAAEWAKRCGYLIVSCSDLKFSSALERVRIRGDHKMMRCLLELMADTEWMKKSYEWALIEYVRLLDPTFATQEKAVLSRQRIHYQVPEISRDPCEGAIFKVCTYDSFYQRLEQEYENVFGSLPRLSGFKEIDEEVEYGSPALERGLELSRTIVTHLNRLFKYSENYPKRSKGENVNYDELRVVVSYVQKGNTALESITRTISYNEGNWMGNCNDMALIGMQFQAHNNNGLSVERYQLNQGNHVFLVVGRDPKTNPFDPSKWNEEAVICDPWAIAYYPARRYRDFLAGYAGLLIEGSPDESDSYTPIIDPLENVMHRGPIWISPFKLEGEQYPVNLSSNDDRPPSPTPIAKKQTEESIPINYPETPKIDFQEVMTQVNQMILFPV